MRLVDHLLIKVRLEQLHLFAAEFNGAIHNGIGSLAEMPHAHRNIGGVCLELPDLNIGFQHEVGVLFCAVLPQKRHDLLHEFFRIRFGIAYGLHVDIHDDLTGKLLQDLFKGHNRKVFEFFPEFGTEIQLFQVCIPGLGDKPRTAADAVKGLVMAGNDDPIL